MTNQISAINLGELAEPINTLITKISDAIGVIYEPTRIIRLAKAEVKSEEIRRLSNANISGIEERALNRFLHEEIQKQSNIESIIDQAIALINEDAKTEKIENDWLVKYFEHAKLISDEEMQSIWSRILAGESNAPGKFTKKTLNIISELEKEDAILFGDLCKFYLQDMIVFIFNNTDSILKDYSIDFIALHHLEDIGLIKFDSTGRFRIANNPKTVKATYYDKSLALSFQNDANNDLDIGEVILTREGKQLCDICNSSGNEEILEYIINSWQSKGITVSLI